MIVWRTLRFVQEKGFRTELSNCEPEKYFFPWSYICGFSPSLGAFIQLAKSDY